MSSAPAFLSIVAFCVGCAAAEQRDAGEHRTAQAVPVGESRTDSVRILSTLDRDTAYLVIGNLYNSLIWTSGGGRRTWRAESLYSADPDVTLIMFNRDSLPDLFFTVRWEEFILGELWIARTTDQEMAFKSSDDACRVPEMRDVNGDGLLDIVDWRASALSASECAGDVLAAVCQHQYPTEWPDVWLQVPHGRLVRDSLGSREFYQEMAGAYTAGASALRHALNTSVAPSGEAGRCNRGLLRSLEAMAARAQSIAALR